MRTLFLLFIGVALCGTSMANEPVKELADYPTETYRSDQYRPGLISEYIKVTYTEDRQNIVSIHYWYIARDGMETFESEKTELKLKNAKGFSGEEVGLKGDLQLPESDEYIPFLIAEGTFQITHEEDQYQSFELE